MVGPRDGFDALMQPESRDAYRRFLDDGWTDAIDTLNPRGGVWTYWDYQAGAWQRDHGFRIDHLLLSPELADRMQAAGVDKEYRGREKASDHTPVWVESCASYPTAKHRKRGRREIRSSPHVAGQSDQR